MVSCGAVAQIGLDFIFGSVLCPYSDWYFASWKGKEMVGG